LSIDDFVLMSVCLSVCVSVRVCMSVCVVVRLESDWLLWLARTTHGRTWPPRSHQVRYATASLVCCHISHSDMSAVHTSESCQPLLKSHNAQVSYTCHRHELCCARVVKSPSDTQSSP